MGMPSNRESSNTSPRLPTLNQQFLDSLAHDCQPLVRHQHLRPKMLHFGLGAFHRAHQCVYTDKANSLTNGDWGIVSVANSSHSVVDALAQQDCYYSVTELTPGETNTRVVGSLIEALHLNDDAQRVHDLLCDPELKVVTFTITEKGYRPDGGPFRALAKALSQRARTHQRPLTIISCDNMAENGVILNRTVMAALTNLVNDDDQVIQWVLSWVRFPSTVVDRIVPATTPADLTRAAEALGCTDNAAVVGEPYLQWVIEDNLATELPDWVQAGALVVPDVIPFQLTKLRLLNGSHSALAYLGLAAGCKSVSDTMSTTWGPKLVHQFCAQTAPSIPQGGPDPLEYAHTLVKRFSNPAIVHALSQIGSDGSQKVPYRWLDPVRLLRAKGLPTHLHALAMAGWALATQLKDDGSQRFDTTDPMSAELGACWQSGSTFEAIKSLTRLVGFNDLAADDKFMTQITDYLTKVSAGRIEDCLK